MHSHTSAVCTTTTSCSCTVAPADWRAISQLCTGAQACSCAQYSCLGWLFLQVLVPALGGAIQFHAIICLCTAALLPGSPAVQVADEQHIRRLADRLYDGINSKLSGVVLNGPLDTKHRYVGNLNLSFSYVEGESLLMGLKVGSQWQRTHVRGLAG